MPKFLRDFLLKPVGSRIPHNFRAGFEGISGGARNVINVILGISRDIATGVWTGPIPLLDLSET